MINRRVPIRLSNPSAMKMKTSILKIMMVVLVASQLQLSSTLQTTVPAFMWSPYLDKQVKKEVNYQTISPKYLARSVLSDGGWSDILCTGKSSHQLLDIAFVFVGKELRSEDIAGNTFGETALVDLLQVSFTQSKFSMAFPYVAMEEEGTMESYLLAEFSEACDHKLGVNNVVLMGSCSIEGKGYERLVDWGSVQDYLATRMEKEAKRQPELILYCHGGPNALNGLDQPHSESDVFSNFIVSLEHSGAKYAVLYVSDPYKSSDYPSSWQIERFLTEASSGNGSVNSTTCEGVCQIKTSLLEGILVGIFLLVILISGICCMLGIDTPTRFEKPHDS
ncbi:hypothetical protein Nepgr_011460 [Nepenthes gracilis]|uniref:V-type proton ATPase subunit S1/VOA1 transmembrane domain-containing protein n=1 Tax=Nepenthes gracilis TaxID=150966 RepID=A0AAD3SFD4_NEPGR|nr:hypothetical protein Nepgr_011460 [Nepenthes gracilis]